MDKFLSQATNEYPSCPRPRRAGVLYGDFVASAWVFFHHVNFRLTLRTVNREQQEADGGGHHDARTLKVKTKSK